MCFFLLLVCFHGGSPRCFPQTHNRTPAALAACRRRFLQSRANNVFNYLSELTLSPCVSLIHFTVDSENPVTKCVCIYIYIYVGTIIRQQVVFAKRCIRRAAVTLFKARSHKAKGGRTSRIFDTTGGYIDKEHVVGTTCGPEGKNTASLPWTIL